MTQIFKKYEIDYHLYADDSQLYKSCMPGCFEDVMVRMGECINEVKKWMTINKLQLNSDKTEAMLIRSQRNISHTPSSILLNGHSIRLADNVRNLGAMFDSTMNMSCFVSTLCKSLNHQLHKIGCIRQYLTTDVTKQLITSLVLSKIDYCNSLFAGLPKHRLHKLQTIQNNAARLITRTRKREHITPILSDLHWLPIEQRIRYKIAMLCYKCLHDMAPLYLRQLLSLHVPGRVLRSASDNCRLVQPKMNMKEYGERCFVYLGPKIWNELPYSVRSAPCLASFKSLLKTHLFTCAFQ